MNYPVGHHTHITTPRQLIVRSFQFLGHVIQYCRELGVKVGLRWYFARLRGRLPNRSNPDIVIQPPVLLHPVRVRMSPSSDEYVFDQIFVRHEYEPVCEQLADQKVILDLGANVGYASALLASRYPNAQIIAVEPDPKNFELCCINLKPYGDRIKVLKGAVWSTCSRLALSYELGDGWATQVVAADNEADAQVDAWDIATLLDIAGVQTADLVKIDIEGSEVELFASNTAQWISRVRNICIELHDHRCRDVFFRALSELEYGLLETGESTMCLNMRPRTKASERPSSNAVSPARA